MVVWLDLGNAHVSVSHALIRYANKLFWVPARLRDVLVVYYDQIWMWFATL